MSSVCQQQGTVFSNIRDLPIITNIQSGDTLIVETTSGTTIIDYDNVVWGPSNVTFFSTIQQLQSDVLQLGTLIQELNVDVLQSELNDIKNSLNAVLDEGEDNNVTVINSKINTLSADIMALSSQFAVPADTGVVTLNNDTAPRSPVTSAGLVVSNWSVNTAVSTPNIVKIEQGNRIKILSSGKYYGTFTARFGAPSPTGTVRRVNGFVRRNDNVVNSWSSTAVAIHGRSVDSMTITFAGELNINDELDIRLQTESGTATYSDLRFTISKVG